MKRIAFLIILAVMLAGCASKEEILAYYQAQVQANQVKAAVEAQKKPLLMIEAKDGQDISFTGVKAISIYMPSLDDGKSYQVKQHKDPAYSVGTTVLGIAAGVAGLYLSGQNMVDLASAVGANAGHNTNVGGDYTRDGSTKIGGDWVGGDKAGRDINRDSGNTTNTDDHSGAPESE